MATLVRASADLSWLKDTLLPTIQHMGNSWRNISAEERALVLDIPTPEALATWRPWEAQEWLDMLGNQEDFTDEEYRQVADVVASVLLDDDALRLFRE
ncbi:hypothetical protein [Streptomyces sp. NPDC093097]|uniref:hypothetical protein n=1 Tax=Streptomyces sp. NPDC093097 TaxID=3366027 RepID=UPI003809BF2C